MNAVVALAPSSNSLRQPAPDSRAAALAELDQHLDNLRRCLHWLCGDGFAVIRVEMRRQRSLPQITVAPSPRLHIVLRDECANIGRRQDGALTVYLWIAQRHGCDILWEETTCA